MNCRTLGEKLKEARKLMGLTQDQVAERIGVTSQHYSRMERGLRRIRQNHLKAICKVLCVRLEDILEGTPERDSHDSAFMTALLDEQLSEVILCLSIAQKRVLLRLGKALIEEL